MHSSITNGSSSDRIRHYSSRGWFPQGVLRLYHIFLFFLCCMAIFQLHHQLHASILVATSTAEGGLYDDSVPKVQAIPPSAFPWHRWGNNSEGIQIESVMEIFTKLNNGQSTSYSYYPLVIQSGALHYSRVKMNEIGHGRLVPVEQAILHALEWARKVDQPRIQRALFHKNASLPLIVVKGDEAPCKEPVFTWSSYVACNYTLPIVSYETWIHSFNQYVDTRMKQTKEWNEQYPWKDKVRKAFWRGSATGHNIEWRTRNQRVQLLRYAKNHTDMMDVRFTGDSQIPLKDRADFETEFPIEEKHYTPREEQQNYIAIIDIDGNTWSSRLAMQLCLNSVTIKVEPQWTDYFWEDLKPWVHYIPVNGNLSNLVEHVQYVLSEENAEEIQKIVRNANDWCAHQMTQAQLIIDMVWMLVGYSELLDLGNPMWREKWRANSTVYNLHNLDMKVAVLEVPVSRLRYVMKRKWRNTWKRFGLYKE